MANLVVGCGYLGRRVASAWVERGERVFALTRSTSKAQELADEGIQAVVGDVSSGLPSLPPVETVLHSLGFDRSGGQSIQDIYVDGLHAVLDRLDAEALKRFIYVSSTGVYAQRGGVWVDEQSECRPEREGGQACLAAEELLRGHPIQDRVTVLRLAGIYGPGRIPRRRELAAGQPLRVPTSGYLNLIHVDDAVRVIRALDDSDVHPDLLLVSDGHPVQRELYYRELAAQLGVAHPTFESAPADSPAGRRAAGGDKRVRNTKLQDLLGLEMAYPSYREGLAAILAAERAAE